MPLESGHELANLLLERLIGVGVTISGMALFFLIRRRLIARLFDWGLLPLQRRGNLEQLVLSVSGLLVFLLGTLITLALLGADVWRVLTGAGIAGVALAMGAQNVVRDVIAGFFVVMENQFTVGDYVVINGEVEGIIESVGLRFTKLRGWDGAVVCMGNASIISVKNFNRDAMRVIIELSVPFEADHVKVQRVLEALCAEMATTHREHLLAENGVLLEPPFLYGVTDINSLKGVGATYCIMALTHVDSYWHICREIRRLVLVRLRQHEIHLSYPQRIFHSP